MKNDLLLVVGHMIMMVKSRHEFPTSPIQPFLLLLLLFSLVGVYE